jgi:hypothetical protein
MQWLVLILILGFVLASRVKSIRFERWRITITFWNRPLATTAKKRESLDHPKRRD